MTCPRLSGLAVAGALALALAACTSTSPGSTPPRASSAPPSVASPTASPSSLDIPATSPDEISRVVYPGTGDGVTQTHQRPPKVNVGYVVRGRCLAAASRRAIDYAVIDVRAPHEVVSSGQITCGASVTVDTAVTASSTPVAVELAFTGSLDGVVSAYAVMVPDPTG